MGWSTRGRSSGAARRARHHLSGSPAAPARRTAGGESALSDTYGVYLLVAVTIILAAILLLMLLAMIPGWSWTEPQQPPIVITEISHLNVDGGRMTYASRITLLNNGSTVYENDCLRAIFYVNDQRVCIVHTLRGHLFIPSHHWGVKTLSGDGCRTPYWNPGEKLTLDLTDGTFYPGALVALEIVDKRSEEVISRHAMRA